MKKIWLITPIIFMLLMLFSSILFLFTNKSILDRDVYLDGFNTKTNTKQKGDIVSFVTDPYDNYAIYKPINNKDTNNINEANFYGNIDSYDYAPENNYKMSMWNNDYQCFQWVIKTNNNFKNIKVSANSSDFDIYNDKNIKLDYGFLDFVYASDNGNNEYVVKQKLLVPEKVTSNKKIINVKQNKVYVVLFRVRTVKTLLNKVNLNLNIKATKEDDSIFNLTKKAELNIENNKIVKNNNSDVNIFYFPEWNSYYYNNKEISNFSDSEDDKIKYNIPNDYTEWAKNNIKFNNAYNQENNLDFDYKMYIDYNYNKYWKNAFEYVSNNYGLDWFQLNVSDDYNYHYGNFEYDEKSHTRNPWEFYRKNMNFLNWEYDGDDSYIKFFSASNVDRDFFVNNCINHMKINDKNWEAFNYYLSKCYDSGLRKAMIFSIQNAFNKNVKTLSIFNKNNFFKSLSSVETVQGQELLKWWLNEFKKHIDKISTDSSNPGISKIYNKIKFFYYLDEKSIETSKITNSIIKSFDPEKKYIHLCAALTSKDIDFKDVNSYDRYEYIWVNFLDYYNRSNNDFTKFIADRKKTNLYTGQYSLDSDFTFNLVRSEPGINMYIQQSLVNESGGGVLLFKVFIKRLRKW